jgi:hypothetical protein
MLTVLCSEIRFFAKPQNVENKLRIENLKETRESDRGVAIKDSYNNVVLSTEKSKYWNYRQDRRALDELTRLLKEIKKP